MELGKPQGKVEAGAAALGWRAWAVTQTSRGVRLASPLFDHLWLPGEPAVASCLRHEDPFASALDAHEVRLVTAVLDGIGLQWLLDPSTDVTGTVETYIDRTVMAWRSPAGRSPKMEANTSRTSKGSTAARSTSAARARP